MDRPTDQTYFLQDRLIKVKPNIDLFGIHPQLCHNRPLQWMLRRWLIVHPGAPMLKILLVLCGFLKFPTGAHLCVN
jgi:hypothetical protein